MLHYKSPYRQYGEKQRHDKLVEQLGFPKGWNPKKDEQLQTAIESFKSEVLGRVSVKSLVSLKEGLITSTNVIDVLKDRIDETIRDLNLLEADGDDPLEDAKQTDYLIDRSITYVERLLKLSQAVPKTIDTIADLEAKVRKEESMDKTKNRGGEKTGLFED